MTTIPVPTNEEVAFRQCIEILKINPLAMSTYYSTLFATFKALLNNEDILRLTFWVDCFEDWLSDDLNDLRLHEIELRMYNNMDLNSGFLVNGVLITQLDIIKRLEDIKLWLTGRLYVYMGHIRFTSRLDIN